MQNSNLNPIITVVRSPSSPLGKRFDIQLDGTLRKESHVRLACGLAVQHLVSSHEDLAQLIEKVGEDACSAIINASFPEIPIGEEFAIVSEREIEERLGIPGADRAAQQGVHQIELDGKTMKAVGRFKENVRPSNWQLLDRDVDIHTPDQFAGLSTEEWLSELSAIIPGIDQVSHVSVPSASSRVARDGEPVGRGNGHIWIYVEDPDDIERARPTIILRAMQAGMSWTKPRYSKLKPGEVVGQSQTTIIDPSVLTPGRLVFDGQPSVGEGLTVLPLSAEVHHCSVTVLDTSAMVMPPCSTVRELSQKAGVTYQVDTAGGRLRVTADDLTLDTEIETADGIRTVLERIEPGLTGKLRCQAPFRDSESWAAFLSANHEGLPFVHDVGTGITHWLNEAERNKLQIARASALIDEAIPEVMADGAAALEDGVVSALAEINQANPAEFQRKRAALKQANSQVSLATLDRAVKSWQADKNTAHTHHGYAKAMLAELKEGPWKPVGHHQSLFVVEPDTGRWVDLSVDALVKHVAELHDGKEHCNRRADYKAIADHAISLADDSQFFAEAPVGIACPGGFYQVVGDGISVVPLAPKHRQRVMLPFTPAQQPTPQFEAFLHDTFGSETAGEEEQQITLVQELAGAIMLGLMPRHQKAVLFYEPYGRAGKGTQERILRNLVPKSFVTAITPFRWSHDYHVAALAGSRLNVVGELPENAAIPAAAFKSVLGGDLVTGRHPTHRPITFTNEAAHLFMSNHLITTKDQSEAFYSRWLIVHFPNSRLRSGLPIDPDLAERIITNELPGIAYWSLQGAERLMANGDFSKSMAHERLMAKWRRSTSSLTEFVYECCELSADSKVRRSEFYRSYRSWCSESGRRPFSKARVKELLEHNVGMGVRLVELHGNETFRGLKLKSDDMGPDLGPGF
jgi:putative DNA primase/helicase